MTNAFYRIDDGKATLRLLVELYFRVESASRGVLEASLAESGVGRSAFYSSLKILDELGLIVRERKRVNGKNLVLTKLTDKGKKIGKLIMELRLHLEYEFSDDDA